MNGVNLRRFQFDYDTTWNAFFLDEKLNVYSRYGGRDAGEPEARLSKASLLQTMREVLTVHAQRQRLSPRQRRRLFQPVESGVFRPKDIPLLKQSHQGCVHCHQVREYRFLQSAQAGTFSRRRIYNWPLPENVGIVFERTHGHRIRRVLKDSAAEQAGLTSGDVVTRINNVPIHSEYDVRWVLGRLNDSQPVQVTVSRTVRRRRDRSMRTRTVTVALRLTGNWRETDISWRKSLRSLPLPFGFRGYSLTRSQRRELNILEDRLAIRVVSVRANGTSLARRLGLRKTDTIVALEKQNRKRTLEELKSDLLRNYRAGDVVRFTVLRNGKSVPLSGRFPNWHTEETSVP